jgi:hypothetical protein
MKRLIGILFVVVMVVTVVAPANAQQHNRGNTAGRGGNSPHRSVVISSPRVVVVHGNPAPMRRPIVVVSRPVVVYSSSSWGYNGYSYNGYNGANYYVRSEVADPPESHSSYGLSDAEIQQWSAVARENKARVEAKQIGALDELAQENEQLKQRLELKAEELKLRAENQQLKEELKKLETPPPIPVQE